MAASTVEVILLDGDTNSEYKLYLSLEDAGRAREDMEFATKLLKHAKLVHAAQCKTAENRLRQQQQQQQQQMQLQQQQLQPQQQSQLQQQQPVLEQQPQQQQQPQLQQQQQPQLQQHQELEKNNDDSVHIWCNAEVLLLLDLYKADEAMFSSGKMTQKNCWASIAKKMQDKGHSVSGSKCAIKFQALKRTYKNVIAYNGKSGNDRKEWEYFDIMDDMFRDKPWVKPLSIAGSNIPMIEDSLSNRSNQSAMRKAKVDTALLQYMKDTSEDRRMRREQQEVRHREKISVLNELKDMISKMAPT